MQTINNLQRANPLHRSSAPEACVLQGDPPWGGSNFEDANGKGLELQRAPTASFWNSIIVADGVRVVWTSSGI